MNVEAVLLLEKCQEEVFARQLPTRYLGSAISSKKVCLLKNIP